MAKKKPNVVTRLVNAAKGAVKGYKSTGMSTSAPTYKAATKNRVATGAQAIYNRKMGNTPSATRNRKGETGQLTKNRLPNSPKLPGGKDKTGGKGGKKKYSDAFLLRNSRGF